MVLAQNLAVIGTANATFLGKQGRNPFNLFFSKPK
jgi:hypothetical protein